MSASARPPPPLHHLALRVADLARAEAFWCGTVGLAVLARHPGAEGAPRSVWLELGGGAILMLERAEGRRAGPADAAGGFVAALRIAPGERQAWRRALAARGVAVVHETPFTLYIEDPEGNRVGFSHFPERADEGG